MPSIESREAVRVVVERVDAPRVAGAVVVRVLDAVQQRVAHLHVGRRHVDLGAQTCAPSGNSPARIRREEVEVLLDGALAVRALLAGLGERAAVLADLCLAVRLHDVGLARLDELHRELVEPLEVVRREESARPSRSRASARRAGSTRRTPCPRSPGWCRRSAGGSAPPNSAASAEVRGRSTSRGRCAGSRSARAGSGSRPACACRRRGPRR